MAEQHHDDLQFIAELRSALATATAADALTASASPNTLLLARQLISPMSPPQLPIAIWWKIRSSCDVHADPHRHLPSIFAKTKGANQ